MPFRSTRPADTATEPTPAADDGGEAGAAQQTDAAADSSSARSADTGLATGPSTGTAPTGTATDREPVEVAGRADRGGRAATGRPEPSPVTGDDTTGDDTTGDAERSGPGRLATDVFSPRDEGDGALPVSPDSGAAPTGAGTRAASAPGTGGVGAEPRGFLGTNAAEVFRARWREVQARFVDAPADAARDARELVDEVIDAWAQAVSDERTRVAGEHDRAGSDTEGLRVALRDYRLLADRLLDA